jgi:hypothetical protein
MKWGFLGLWLGLSALIWWFCVRLKRVRIDSHPVVVELRELSARAGGPAAS